MRIFLIGCGYVGLPLGKALAEMGHEVHGVRRTNFTAEGITSHALDITEAGALDALPRNFDWVINTVSSARGDAETHRAVFVDGTKNLLDWLGDSTTRVLFTSSTSVYPQTDSAWVDEASPVDGPVLREAEALFLNATQAATVLRVAGIYGPKRGYLFRQFLRGEAVLTEGGKRWINMIHRDDVVGAILAAIKLAPGIYNVADDEPVTQLAFFKWLASRLEKSMPPEGERVSRKRVATSKRVRNAKLKALGWKLRFPTFREGYENLIREE
ncbi:MAG: SDR family oxidoreductase [Verrucomicrobia subdivision 3 bacterium]|nr:SDR family oxidoreductase [Limisphaerales bacterium]